MSYLLHRLLKLLIAIYALAAPVQAEPELIRDGLWSEDGILLFEAGEGVFLKNFSSSGKADSSITLNVDRDSWRHIGGAYFQDKNRIFFYRPGFPLGALFVLEGLRPDDLKFMCSGKWTALSDISRGDNASKCGFAYSWRKGKVFHDSECLDKVDPEAFKVIDYVEGSVLELYSTDGTTIYFGAEVVTKEAYLAEALALALSGNPGQLKYAKAMAELIGGVYVP
jgi:hypothetical protein